MPTPITNVTTYSGEFLGEYLSASLLSGKTLNEGAVTIKPNVKFKSVLKTLSLTGAIADAECDFTDAGTPSLNEVVLEPKSLQVNLQLCKTDFRDDWEAVQMGFSAFDNLPPTFESFIMGHIAEQIAETIEKNLWNGDDSAGSGNNLFEGFEQRITSSTLNIGATTVSSSNVIQFLGGLVDAIPTAVYGKDDVMIYVPNNVFQAYVRALGGFAANIGAQGIDNKGTTHYSMGSGLTFDGIPLQMCPGMSNNRGIVAQKSNLYFGTGLVSDMNEVKLIDMADIDGSQNVRFVSRFTAGTQVGIPSDTVHLVASDS